LTIPSGATGWWVSVSEIFGVFGRQPGYGGPELQVLFCVSWLWSAPDHRWARPRQAGNAGATACLLPPLLALNSWLGGLAAVGDRQFLASAIASVYLVSSQLQAQQNGPGCAGMGYVAMPVSAAILRVLAKGPVGLVLAGSGELWLFSAAARGSYGSCCAKIADCLAMACFSLLLGHPLVRAGCPSPLACLSWVVFSVSAIWER